jgi:hypothetical protein
MGLVRRWAAVCLLLAVVLWSPYAFGAPETLTATLTFDAGSISIDNVGGFDVVRLRGAAATTEVARPELPLFVARFALPLGTEAAGVSARVITESELPGVHRVRPAQPQVPLSRTMTPEWVAPDESVYSSPALYPSVDCELLSTGTAAGQPIASVAVYPVRYSPSDGRLILTESVEVTVDLRAARGEARMPGPVSPRTRDLRADRVRALVLNPEAVLPAPSRPETRSSGIDYLIITSSSYASLFQPLADWKTGKGVSAAIVTTGAISAGYQGADLAEKIRNCIIDYYENQGTLWVLLGGDTDVVPDREAYAKSGDSGEDIPCDLYYADLDGTWDADGDGVYGENATDQVDMYADVYVGRAPVNTATEVSRFVNKVLTYEGAPGGDQLPIDYQQKMLFMAEVLWDSPYTDHAICKNMIDDDSVPAQFDPITKLYETNGLLTKSRVISELNTGYNIVNHNGHANYNVMSIGSSALYNSDFDGLTNGSRYGIMYSIGCWAAAIDYNAIAEHWVNAANGGGVAFVGNTRYGWGSPGAPGYGVSDEFDREFFNQLFNEGLDQIGATTAVSRDAFVGQAHSDAYYRFALYETVLLGDPEMRIWTLEPDGTATVNHATEIPLGEHPFVVTVAKNGAPIDGANVLLSNDEVYESAITGPDGVAVLHPAPTVEGPINLTVTGQAITPFSASLEVADLPADTEPPDAIHDLSVGDPYDTGGVVALDWSGYSPPADFATYRIYRDTSPFTSVAGRAPLTAGLIDGSVRAWNDDSVVDGTAYYYAVTAVDLAGNERAAVSSVGPVVPTDNALILVWDADDGDQPFDGVGDQFTLGDGTEVPWTQALDEIGELYDCFESLPADLSHYDLVVYLGGITNIGEGALNTPLTEDEIAALTDYVDGGGSLYVEEPGFGGRYYVNGTAASIELWNRFHATFTAGAVRTTGNVESVTGEAGALMDGLSLAYDYQDWPDQFVGLISSNDDPGSSQLWLDQGSDGRGTLYVDPATGSHRYMVPVLLGGMSDGADPSTRNEIVTRILADCSILGETGVDEGPSAVGNRLGQNAPNPFNPSTSIHFAVGREGARVSLAIYDVAGRRVATLYDGRATAGDHSVRWDGRDGSGRRVASGVYFSRLSVDGWTASRKMVLLK